MDFKQVISSMYNVLDGGQAQRLEQQKEENALRMQLLKHQIDRLKFQEKLEDMNQRNRESEMVAKIMGQRNNPVVGGGNVQIEGGAIPTTVQPPVGPNGLQDKLVAQKFNLAMPKNELQNAPVPFETMNGPVSMQVPTRSENLQQRMQELYLQKQVEEQAKQEAMETINIPGMGSVKVPSSGVGTVVAAGIRANAPKPEKELSVTDQIYINRYAQKHGLDPAKMTDAQKGDALIEAGKEKYPVPDPTGTWMPETLFDEAGNQVVVGLRNNRYPDMGLKPYPGVDSTKGPLYTTPLPPMTEDVRARYLGYIGLQNLLPKIEAKLEALAQGPLKGRMNSVSYDKLGSYGLTSDEIEAINELELLRTERAFATGGKQLTITELERIVKTAPSQNDKLDAALIKLKGMKNYFLTGENNQFDAFKKTLNKRHLAKLEQDTPKPSGKKVGDKKVFDAGPFKGKTGIWNGTSYDVEVK